MSQRSYPAAKSQLPLRTGNRLPAASTSSLGNNSAYFQSSTVNAGGSAVVQRLPGSMAPPPLPTTIVHTPKGATFALKGMQHAVAGKLRGRRPSPPRSVPNAFVATGQPTVFMNETPDSMGPLPHTTPIASASGPSATRSLGSRSGKNASDALMELSMSHLEVDEPFDRRTAYIGSNGSSKMIIPPAPSSALAKPGDELYKQRMQYIEAFKARRGWA